MFEFEGGNVGAMDLEIELFTIAPTILILKHFFSSYRAVNN